MNCKNCGNKLNDYDKFCMKCGMSNEHTKKETSKVGLIVGIILLVIGVGITIGTFFFFWTILWLSNFNCWKYIVV